MIVAWIIAETPGIVNTMLGFFARAGSSCGRCWPARLFPDDDDFARLALRRKRDAAANQTGNRTSRAGESPELLSRIVHHDPSSLARITASRCNICVRRVRNIEAVQTRARHGWFGWKRASLC
jgi:hypothetical protein